MKRSGLGVVLVAVLACLASLACGATESKSASDAGSSADASSSSSSSSSSSGGGPDSGGPSCQDLAAKASALLVKTCTGDAECAVTTVYNCCVVYTGIRADKKAAFEAAQAAYNAACPDLRGCQCQDHTETNELVPVQTPPLPVSATCDVGKCTAHQK